ncbi:hypothetical protein FIA58_008795 [Flavobacterium jejuense]|uniref:NmrA-like domain-containing protein n=1 Tax=Flavobacterium jejuense TaxID=1544455 RepID=A0ABX0IPL7_9FLAO|nr:hypothetical protein [Flavobacterium jejuense]NHN25769.1 hypothetical protein [Flavobacterium jejuense]
MSDEYEKQAIHKIKDCGIPYTIFYSSNLMENLTGGMRDGNKINIIGKSTEKAWWIAGEDLGKMVAKSFETEKALNKEYSVQGLEAMTTLEATTAYVENYTKEKLKIAKLPMELAKFLSLFVKPLKFVVPLIDVMNKNKETFEAQKTWDDLEKPSIRINQFAKM